MPYKLCTHQKLGVKQNENLILIFEIKKKYKNIYIDISISSIFSLDSICYHFMSYEVNQYSKGAILNLRRQPKGDLQNVYFTNSLIYFEPYQSYNIPLTVVLREK